MGKIIHFPVRKKQTIDLTKESIYFKQTIQNRWAKKSLQERIDWVIEHKLFVFEYIQDTLGRPISYEDWVKLTVESGKILCAY